MIDLQQALKTAQNAALNAGDFLLQEQKKVEIIKFKDRQDILTSADLGAEKIIIKTLQS